MDKPAKSACSAASLLFPESGKARQPLDRQFRYYSEGQRLASRRAIREERREHKSNLPHRRFNCIQRKMAKKRPTHESHSQGVASMRCTGHWPPVLFLTQLLWLCLFRFPSRLPARRRRLLPGTCFFFGCGASAYSLNITGAMNSSNRQAVCAPFIFIAFAVMIQSGGLDCGRKTPKLS